MDFETLRSLDGDSLADYLWKRLRLEEPLDPPLDRRFRMEPPEDFLIGAVHELEDPAFTHRLVGAIRRNLSRQVLIGFDEALDATSSEQLASLAFLATAVGDPELAQPLYAFLLTGITRSEGERHFSDLTLFHLLRACARLQNDARYLPLWEETWRRERAPNLRAIAYYGLTRADDRRAMTLLAEVLGDEELDLPVIAWHLATEVPGVIALGEAAARLPQTLRQSLRGALEQAGADADLLADFDLHSEPVVDATNFPFDDPPPADPTAAESMPSWSSALRAA